MILHAYPVPTLRLASLRGMMCRGSGNELHVADLAVCSGHFQVSSCRTDALEVLNSKQDHPAANPSENVTLESVASTNARGIATPP